jgi:hypothetical protein
MKTFNNILALFMLFVSCIIGYNAGIPTANANESPVIPRFVDVPRTTNTGFDLNIDLNSGKITANNSNYISVAIQKKDSIVYKYKTSVVKEVKYIKVRELPAVKEKKTFVSPNFEQPTQLCVK